MTVIYLKYLRITQISGGRTPEIIPHTHTTTMASSGTPGMTQSHTREGQWDPENMGSHPTKRQWDTQINMEPQKWAVVGYLGRSKTLKIAAVRNKISYRATQVNDSETTVGSMMYMAGDKATPGSRSGIPWMTQVNFSKWKYDNRKELSLPGEQKLDKWKNIEPHKWVAEEN